MRRSRRAATDVRSGRARRVLAAGGVLAVSVVALAAYLTQLPRTAHGPIILISIDTLRADRLSAYGYAGGHTPALDALVNAGVVFERAYTHSPLTLPAHASILTGQLPHQHGVRDNVGFVVDANQKQLPHWLREAGYATGAVVSSAVLREATGIGAAFDFFDGRMPPSRGGVSLDEAQRDGESSLAIAHRWIQQQKSRAWFLLLHLYEPHAPYSPPPRYRHLSPYDGEIAHADEIVGSLIEALRRCDLYDASTIVLLSDHGEGLGDHGEQEHGLFLYEESLRVPFVVSCRGNATAGRGSLSSFNTLTCCLRCWISRGRRFLQRWLDAPFASCWKGTPPIGRIAAFTPKRCSVAITLDGANFSH